MQRIINSLSYSTYKEYLDVILAMFVTINKVNEVMMNLFMNLEN